MVGIRKDGNALSEVRRLTTIPSGQLVLIDDRQQRTGQCALTRADNAHLRERLGGDEGLEEPEDPGEDGGDVHEELGGEELGVVVLENLGRFACCGFGVCVAPAEHADAGVVCGAKISVMKGRNEEEGVP